MKLIALNTGLDEFGFPDEMTMHNKDFHGHLIGIPVCKVKRPENREDLSVDNIIENETKNIPDEKLVELIKNDSVLFVGSDQHPGEGEEVLYLPYAVEKHTAYEPSVNFQQVPLVTHEGELTFDPPNTMYDINVEFLFVIGNMNRYVTVGYNTDGTSLFDCIRKFFDDVTSGIKDPEKRELMEELGFSYNDNTISLDFYDPVGMRQDIPINNEHQLSEYLTSIRITDIRKSMEIQTEE